MVIETLFAPPSQLPVGQRSRKQIAPFELHRPRALDEAIALWRELGREADLLAGGIDLVNAMKQGHRPRALVDLRGVPELRGFEVDEQGFAALGAMLTHRQLAGAEPGAGALTDLARLWTDIGNPRIRQKGTLGGNLMARNPGYDLMPCLSALDARLIVADSSGAGDSRRGLSARAGLPEAGSFVIGIRFASRGVRLLFERSHKPLISVALAAARSADGHHVDALAVALGCLSAAPPWAHIRFDRPVDCMVLAGQAPVLAQQLLSDLSGKMSGEPADKDYRRHLAGVLARRLIARLGQPDASS